jgi:hypothetical protein
VTSEQFFNAIFTKTKRDDWVPTAINLTMPGESIELIGSLRAPCNSPLILKVEDYFALTIVAALSMSRLDERVEDKQLLKLIQAFLNAGAATGHQTDPQ